MYYTYVNTKNNLLFDKQSLAWIYDLCRNNINSNLGCILIHTHTHTT